MDIMEFVNPALSIIVAVLIGLGYFLKTYKAFTQEWSIPFILLGVSVILTPLYMAFVMGLGLTAAVLINGFIQGVLCATVAVFLNETVKQVAKKRKEDQK